MSAQAWKTKWPQTKSVKDWIVASGEKVLAIKDPEERMDKLGFAIERLAERNFKPAAKPLFAAYEKDVAKHPDALSVNSAAETYIAMGKREAALALFRAEFEQIESDKKLKPAKRADKLKYARKDALHLRLTELFGDLTPEERGEADYYAKIYAADAALKKKDKAAARKLAREAEKAVKHAPRRAGRWWAMRLLGLHADLGDKPSALRMLKLLDEDDRNVAIIGEDLLKLGLKDLVVKLARKEIAAKLDDARTMGLPNYHFPANRIAGVIEFLVKHGEKTLARQEMDRVLKEIGSWKTQQSGWVESAVYSALALPVAKLDGRKAAEVMLNRAGWAAHGERSSFRSGAWEQIIEVYEAIGAWDEALDVAKKQGSKEDRRQRQAILLAKAGRMKDVAKVLKDVKDPIEAADVCWWIAAALDGL